MAFTKPAHGNGPGGEYPRPIEKVNYNRADDMRQRWLDETGENHLSTANSNHCGSLPTHQWKDASITPKRNGEKLAGHSRRRSSTPWAWLQDAFSGPKLVPTGKSSALSLVFTKPRDGDTQGGGPLGGGAQSVSERFT